MIELVTLAMSKGCPVPNALYCLWEIQSWLREHHNIQVYAYSNTTNGKIYKDYVCHMNEKQLNDSRDEKYSTHDEALKFGLLYALNTLP